MSCQGQARVCEAARRVVDTAPPFGPLSTSARHWEFLSALEQLRAALAESSPPVAAPDGPPSGSGAGGDPTLPRGAYEAVPRRCTDPACPDRRNGTGEHMHLAVRYHPGAATTAELFTVGPAPQPEVEP